MPSYNRVIMIGRLTRDPELKYTSGGLAVTTFTIAVDRKFKNQAGERQTDFFRCKAWRQKAEFVANYVNKGRLVAIDGSIETSEVVGQDGQKRYFTDIVCDNVETLDSQRDSEGGAPGGQGGYGGQQGGGQGAPQGRNNAPMDDGGGYFPDEDVAPPQRAQVPRAQGGQAPAGNGGAAQRPPANRATPAAAYPEDDFDDSDPFADQ